jgi:hypothetical protein
MTLLQIVEAVESDTLKQSEFNGIMLGIIAGLIAILGGIGGWAVNRLMKSVDGMTEEIHDLRVDLTKTDGRVAAIEKEKPTHRRR